MSTEYRITPAVVSWKVSFNLALLLHILVISSGIYLPQLFNGKPVFPEIYTVDLVNIADPLPAASQPAPPPPAQPEVADNMEKPEAIKDTEAVAIDSPPANSPSIEPVKPISIKPLKRKLKKKIPRDTSARDAQRRRDAELRRQQQLLEAKKQQLLEEARRQQAIADAEAKTAASEALNALKQSLHADAEASSARSRRGTTGGGGAASSLENQYYSSIFSHLHQYWSLPDIKQWSADVSAVVVITIAKNGTILSHEFERYSGDKVFDRFVSRTLEDANPLPAIPPALKKNQYTIGLRFRPGGIQ